MTGNSGFFSSLTGISCNPLSCIKGVKSAFELQEAIGIALEAVQGKRASSRIEGGIS